MQRFVVIGAGVAGHRAAIELARLAPGATVDLLSEEPHLPYDRPPLSKELLHGSKTAEQIVLSGASTYLQNNISFHPRTRVTAIDRDRQIVLTDRHTEFGYDRLLITTGSRPRRLSEHCAGDAPVLYLRTLYDSIQLAPCLCTGKRLLVIGAGFIGLEVAAAAVRKQCRVVVLESQPRVLARGTPPLVSEWIERKHRAEGVEIRLSTSVRSLQRDRSEVVVTSSEGTMIADIVIAGIGAVPNVELAEEAGLEVRDGIIVDERCRTSDPNIFSAGEVTCHPLMHGPARRIESWKSSGEQGTIAARAMTGMETVFDEIPSLWSDQFDMNIQSIGFPELAIGQEILGDPASNAWTLVSLGKDGTIVGGIAINRGRDASALRRAVRQRADMEFMQPRVA